MTKTVMIVEDNELNMKLFNDLLEAHGYATVQTRSGKEAVGLATPLIVPQSLLSMASPRRLVANLGRLASR